MENEKKCTNCFKLKSKSEFYTRKSHDGYQSRCKACNTEVVKGYRTRAKDPTLRGHK